MENQGKNNYKNSAPRELPDNSGTSTDSKNSTPRTNLDNSSGTGAKRIKPKPGLSGGAVKPLPEPSSSTLQASTPGAFRR